MFISIYIYIYIYIYICQCLKDVPHSKPDFGDIVIVCLKDINFKLNFDITDYLRGLIVIYSYLKNRIWDRIMSREPINFFKLWPSNIFWNNDKSKLHSCKLQVQIKVRDVCCHSFGLHFVLLFVVYTFDD